MAYKSKAAKKKQLKMILTGVAAALVVVLALAIILPIINDKTPAFDPKNENDPIAVITMNDGSKIVVELYPEVAPNTVANFVELASSGFYDGLTFHRVISGFMIQGGDPDGNGTGGPGYSIKGEFAANGFTNNLSHTRGVISMARSTAYDSAGSQFFIMHGDAAYLNGSYAAFGEVIAGMDTVDKIASVSTNSSDKPYTSQVIKSIKVDTKGVTYTAEKIK